MHNQTIPTRNEMTNNILILNEEVEINEVMRDMIREIYFGDYGKYSLLNINDTDEHAHEYFMSIYELCLKMTNFFDQAICFKSLVNVFIDEELLMAAELREPFNENISTVESQKYRFGIFEKFEYLINSPASQQALMTSKSGYIIEEMIANSFDEADRLIKYYAKKLKSPFSDADIYVDAKDLMSKKESFGDVFTKDKKFTHLVRNNHGLSPLIKKGDIIFYTKDEKIIHLPFLRGLVTGHIKKFIINSIDTKSMITELNRMVEYLSKANDDGSLKIKIEKFKKMVSYLDWTRNHKRVIEYFDISKYLNLNADEVKKLAVKVSNVEGRSFPNNIEKLINSDACNLEIDNFIDVVDEYDRVLLFGIEEDITQ